MHQKIKDLIKEALKMRDEVRLLTLRGALSSFTNELLSLKRKPQESLSDEEVILVIKRLVKQRKDSIEQFEKGGRKDLADNEKAELKILEEFLPVQMSEEKIREIAKRKIEEIGLVDKSKLGQVIGIIIKETKGEADGGLVKKIVEELMA